MSDADLPRLQLVARGLTMRFGGLVAVSGLDLVAEAGRVTSVIGPNGAGKTTAFNCITGFYKPSAGDISLRQPDGRSRRIDSLPGHRVVTEAKVVRTFQNIAPVRRHDGARKPAGGATPHAESRSGLLQLQGLIGLAVLPPRRRGGGGEKAMALARLGMGLAARANDFAGGYVALRPATPARNRPRDVPRSALSSALTNLLPA